MLEAALDASRVGVFGLAQLRRRLFGPLIRKHDLLAVGIEHRLGVRVGQANGHVGAEHLLDVVFVELDAEIVGAIHGGGAVAWNGPRNVRRRDS